MGETSERTGEGDTGRPPDPEAVPGGSAGADPGSGTDPFRVLVVDDQPLNRKVAQALLEARGYAVDLAENGRSAVEFLRSHPCDAVIMDLQMPEMDGLAATRAIRGDLGLEELPIIALTTESAEADRKACLDAGMNDHLAKPIDDRPLSRALERWIRPRRTRSSGTDPAALSLRWRRLPNALPGFDIREAKRRTSWNDSFLKRLMIEFSERYIDTPRILRERLAGGGIEEAGEWVRGLGEAAGTLSARKLHLTAHRLERSLRGEDPEMDPEAFGEFEAALGIVMETIQRMGGGTPDGQTALPPPTIGTPPPRIDCFPPPVPASELLPLLEKMETLLRQRNMRAEECLENLMERVQGGPLRKNLDAIAGHVQGLDFEGAGEEVRRMRRRVTAE